MKKNILLMLCFGFLSVALKSQSADYSSLLTYIKTHTNENTLNKLIAVNIWSPDDKNSREANVDLNNTCFIFKNAKLKGGSSGVIGVVICPDNDEVNVNIALKKDGITNVVIINASDLALIPSFSKKETPYNVVYDSDGKVVYDNIQNISFLNSIRNLITR